MKPTTLTAAAATAAALSALQPFSLSALCSDAERPNTARPNIILIVADDLGQQDLGCYNPGTFYETPNLDRFARQAVRFTNGYAANPVCSPTRVSLQTGRYPTRTSNTYWFSKGPSSGKSFDLKGAPVTGYLPLDEETLGEGLKKAGYQTAFIGKWHLGEQPKYWPDQRGYETDIAGTSAGGPLGGYFSPYHNDRLPDGPKGEYLPERINKEALALLDKLAADKTKPFFLCHCFYLVHAPIVALDPMIAKYTAKAKKLGVNNAQDFGTEEQCWPIAAPRKIRIRQGDPVYAAMIEEMDTCFGRLMDELDRLGIANNTLILFIGDNGGLATTDKLPTSNLPYRGGKGWVYEGGIREPYLVRWPAAIKAGTTNDTPVISNDVLPTFFAAAGAELPAKKLDGLNLLPLMQTGAPLDRDALFWHFPHYGGQGGFPGGAIRMGDWKLIERYLDGSVQLYNLKNDIGERLDLAAKEPARVAAMKTRLHAWYKEVNAQFLQKKGANGPVPWRPDQPPRAAGQKYAANDFTDDFADDNTTATRGLAASAIISRWLPIIPYFTGFAQQGIGWDD